ncbi:hypothetical protein DIE07_33120 [Burkholderia sp. Bp9002]|nr:hypothetical protein DIE07_33120 [Burkholderia sp. Bp9002]
MSFFGNCGSRHGFVTEHCDPSSAARIRYRGRAAVRRAGWRLARKTEAGVPRPFGVPSTEK